MLGLHRTSVVVALILASRAEAQQSRDFAPYLMADRAAEVALARTAAPRHVSDSATVLVLTRTGYTTAMKGTNGFTCLVERAFQGSVADPTFWNSKVRAPHCFNPPAVRTILPQALKRAEWILAGVSTQEITTREHQAYENHTLPSPAAGAMAYMMSPKQYLLDNDPHWMPHLMFYHDRSLPGAVWGAGGMTDPVIDDSGSDPKSPVITLLIPVRRWSDGTPSLSTAAH
jgi:hypothetical protein